MERMEEMMENQTQTIVLDRENLISLKKDIDAILKRKENGEEITLTIVQCKQSVSLHEI